MTTLNQAFIRVYAKQLPAVADGSGSQLSGPLGVQLRVDAGGPVSAAAIPGALSAMEPIHTDTGPEKTVTAAEVEMQIVASEQSAPVAASLDCLVSMDSPDTVAVGQAPPTSEFYVATCVKAPLLSDEIQWPSVCRALTQAASGSLQAAGKTLSQAVAEGMKYIAVTSAEAEVGVTTTTICLARAAAEQGVRVALVDAHFADPQLAVEMGLTAPFSWHQPAGNQETGVLAIPLEKEGVAFYPLQVQSPDDLTDWTHSPLATRLQEISRYHDLVLLDVGPVLVAWGYGFRKIATELIDAAVLVRDRRQVDDFVTAAAIDRLRRAGLEVVMAENFVS